MPAIRVLKYYNHLLALFSNDNKNLLTSFITRHSQSKTRHASHLICYYKNGRHILPTGYYDSERGFLNIHIKPRARLLHFILFAHCICAYVAVANERERFAELRRTRARHANAATTARLDSILYISNQLTGQLTATQ